MTILTALQSPLLVHALFGACYVTNPILMRWRHGNNNNNNNNNNHPPSISTHHQSSFRVFNNRSLSSTLSPIWLSFDTISQPYEGKNNSRDVLRVMLLPSSFSAPRDRNITLSHVHTGTRQGGEQRESPQFNRSQSNRDSQFNRSQSNRESQFNRSQSNRYSHSNRLSQIPPLKPSQIALQDRETFYKTLSMHTLPQKTPSQISHSNPSHSSQISQSNLPNITYSIFAGQSGRVVYLPWLDVFLVVYTIFTPHHMVTPGITVVSRSTDNAPGASTLGKCPFPYISTINYVTIF